MTHIRKGDKYKKVVIECSIGGRVPELVERWACIQLSRIRKRSLAGFRLGSSTPRLHLYV